MRKSLYAVALSTAILSPFCYSKADQFTLNGFYDCTKATNGHAYCKQVGRGNVYIPVSDAFLDRYLNEQNVTLTPKVSPPTPVVNNTVNQSLSVEVTQINVWIGLFKELEQEQKTEANTPGECGGSGNKSVPKQATKILQNRVTDYQSQFDNKTRQLGGYITPVEPTGGNQYITSRKASEMFPKVPWKIPGTNETGEFWLEPQVTDIGELRFNLKFVESQSIDKVRSEIQLTEDEVSKARDALCKVVQWGDIAHENELRRNVSKRAACFPEGQCPQPGEKRPGTSSTEIVFQVFQDGTTDGRIQRNKGMFEEGYNISTESALLLETYFTHIITKGKKEFMSGTQTDEQVKELFK